MKFDNINYWSEVKLDIIRKYAQAYSTIICAQKKPSLYHIYIDAFAGAGIHFSKRKGEFVLGSPLNALNIDPPFKELHLIDLNPEKSSHLTQLTSDASNVTVYNEDCNRVLIEKIFPMCLYREYKRALCLLDPYGLHLDWHVIAKAGEMKSVEIFLNFPVADMNRNVLWTNRERVDEAQIIRLNAFWGDDSWKKVAYDSSGNLFGIEEKTSNLSIAKAFQQRLKKVAGFSYVAEPMPMRNRKHAVVYYLFFASQKPVAANIVSDIFDKYRNKGTQ
jgi:three-Cys-motif partner protein